MKYYQIILLISGLVVLLFTLGCAKNDNSLATNTNIINKVSTADWHTISFSQEGLSYSFMVPKDWELTQPGYPWDENPDLLKLEDELTTIMHSPSYNTSFEIISTEGYFGVNIGLYVRYYNNTTNFEDWYSEHRNEFFLPASGQLAREGTMIINGKHAQFAELNETRIQDAVNNTGISATRKEIFIPLTNKVLKIDINSDTWLMDHFQSTVDEIISSIIVE